MKETLRQRIRHQYQGARCMVRSVARALAGRGRCAREDGRLLAARRAIRLWARLWVLNRTLDEMQDKDEARHEAADRAAAALNAGLMIGYRPQPAGRYRGADVDLRQASRGYDPRERGETVVLPAGPAIVDFDSRPSQYGRGSALRAEGYANHVAAVLRGAGYQIREKHGRRRKDWTFDRWGCGRVAERRRQAAYEEELRESIIWDMTLHAVHGDDGWTLEAHHAHDNRTTADVGDAVWDSADEARAYAEEHGDELRLELAKGFTTRGSCVSCQEVVVVEGNYVAYGPAGNLYCGTCLGTEDEPAAAAIVR